MAQDKIYVCQSNNKDADQPAHSRSLISAFVGRCLGSLRPYMMIVRSKTIAEQLAHLSLIWLHVPEDRFSLDMAHNDDLCHMQTTKTQISLHIRTVWSAPLLFTAQIV